MEQWIWHSLEGSTNEYIDFEQRFVIGSAFEKTTIQISIFGEYTLYINGVFVGCGQYHDFPDNKVFDEYEISGFLHAGENQLYILGYYPGIDTFSHIHTQPGLFYRINSGDAVVAEAAQAHCRKNPYYQQGEMARITGQLGFSFAYDATKETAEAWKEPVICAVSYQSFQKRPIEKVCIGERVPGRIVNQGYVTWNRSDRSDVAACMQTDYLAFCSLAQLSGTTEQALSEDGVCFPVAQTADGVYFIVDLGRESCGYLTLDIEASQGARVDISYGEHLEDMRVRAKIEGRNFATTYICSGGRQRFTYYTKRIAGRYLEIHLSNHTQEGRLYYLGLYSAEYPLEKKGVFWCNDTIQNRILSVCDNTLRLCLHEHYEDCPWREQALYGADSRNQMLFGYYLYGEYQAPKASLRLLLESLRPDGLIGMCAPMRGAKTIPSFTFWWMIAATEYVLFSGDKKEGKAYLQAFRRVIDHNCVPDANGLLRQPTDASLWHFYEWRTGLGGAYNGATHDKNRQDNLFYDAPYQLFALLAMRAALWLASEVQDSAFVKDYVERCDTLEQAIDAVFWDGTNGLYWTYSIDGHLEHQCELVQCLAICADVCKKDKMNILLSHIMKHDLIPVSLCNAVWKIDALMRGDTEDQRACYGYVTKLWGDMLYQGATSFWETEEGADAFNKAGSLCHGWSAAPVYFYFRYVLGVYPTKPGYETYLKEPRFGSLQYEGTVPTPNGPIVVSKK